MEAPEPLGVIAFINMHTQLVLNIQLAEILIRFRNV